MYTHIVMWKLQDQADGRSRAENARLMKERFEELANMLDGLTSLDVGIGVVHTPDSADVVVSMAFATRAAYDAGVDHPAHRALGSFIAGVCAERRAIDYES